MRPCWAERIRGGILALACVAGGAAGYSELRVPGFTAYSEPNTDALRVSSRSGTTRWADASARVLWFGQLRHAGDLACSLEMRATKDTPYKLRLMVAGQTREASGTGTGTDMTVTFGKFEVKTAGYQRIVLETLTALPEAGLNLGALILEGAAADEAHFNLKQRRNAASVHLVYPTPDDVEAAAFYCEVTAVEDPVWTFYMACGWHRGYFGMQVNSEQERRIIFSVWDSGGEAVDRAKVADENRVRLVAKGDGVYAGDFGNEGTGGHSHLKYLWKTGEKQRFVVTARRTDSTHTTFSGFYFHPDKREWVLISSWNAPKEGGHLRRLHSFSENFGGDNGQLRRKALYGNQWMKTVDGKWTELTTASFSHDSTGKADRLDRFMGLENGEFFLSHGGFIEGFTKYGDRFTRPPDRLEAPELRLPAVPE